MGELRQLNEQNKLALWAERVSECRNSRQSVLAWCKEHGICSQTYYKWQKRLFTMAKAQHEVQFAEVTPITETPLSQQAAISIHIAGATVDIHSGADAAIVEMILRILKSSVPISALGPAECSCPEPDRCGMGGTAHACQGSG